MNYPIENIYFMLDQIHEGLVILDKNFKFKYINKAAALVFGKSAEEIIGSELSAVEPKSLISNSFKQIISVLNEDKDREWEEYFPNRELWLQFNAYKVGNEIYISFHNISNIKAAFLTAYEERARFALAAKATKDIIWDWDLINNKIWWSDNFYKQLGHKKNDLGSNANIWEKNIHPEDIERVRACIKDAIKNDKELWTSEYRFKLVEGEYSYILDRGYLYYDEEGVAIKMIGAMMNFTDMKEKEIRLLELSKKLHSVIEEERSHLAREIHDELGQELTLLKLELNRIKKSLPSHPEEALLQLNNSLETLKRSINAVKNISFELHPQLIRELGIREALERYIVNFSKRSGLKCTLDADKEFHCDDESKSLTIYRIIQEALSNIIKHANATNVHVSITSRKHYYNISIKDNGIGIAGKPEGRISLGLTGMKERANIINADLEIISNNTGTTINIVVPIK